MHWLQRLKLLGVTSAKIGFSGGGDEGYINQVDYKPDVVVPKELYDTVVDEVNALLCEDHNWWDNDGGGGTATLNVATGELTINMFFYVTETEELDTYTKRVEVLPDDADDEVVEA